MRKSIYGLLVVGLGLTLATAGQASPRQRVTRPWNSYTKYQIPALISARLEGGKIVNLEKSHSLNMGTSPTPDYWETSSDGQWLIADVEAYFSCQGTQSHKQVSVTSPHDSRTRKTGKKSLTTMFKGVKMARASELQALCARQGQWRSYERNGQRSTKKEYSYIRELKLSATCKAPLAPTRHPKTSEKYTVYVECGAVTRDPSTLTQLFLYWNGEKQDNGSIRRPHRGYEKVRTQGYIYTKPSNGTVPLRLFLSDARGDFFSAASPQSIADAKKAGYRELRVLGHVYPKAVAGSIPLKVYWHPGRKDNFTTTTARGEADAKKAGYQFVRVDSWVIP